MQVVDRDGFLKVRLSGASDGLTVGTTPISSGTNGRVLFQGTGNVLQQSSSLFWDGTNNRLGVNTSTPSSALQVVGTVNATNIQTPLIFTTGVDQLILATQGGTSAVTIFPTTRNVVIQSGGTTTDAGFRLDVNGTARVRGTSLTDYGFTVANSANNLMFFGAGASNGGLPTISSATGRLMIYPTEGTLNRYVDFSNTSVRFNQLILEGEGGQNNINLSVGGSGALRLTTTISTNPIEFFTNNNNRASITASTGNFLIGTTTDAGFRLDVNGTARISDNFTVAKTTATALSVSLSSLVAQNSFFSVLNGTDGLQLTSRGSGTTGNMGLPANSAEILCFNKAALGLILHTTSYLAIGAHTAERMRLIASTGNLLIGTTTDAGFRLDVNGTARVNGVFSVGADTARIDLWRSSGAFGGRIGTGYSNPAVNHVYIQCDTNSKAILIDDSNRTLFSSSNGDTTTASAQVTINSTTRGFLPPRGTNAQMLAIASPATGLIFFDTTNNKLNCYDGTTWQPCW